MKGNNVQRLSKSRRFPNGAWQVRYRDTDGASRRKAFTSKRDAEQFRAKTVTDIARGDWLDPALAKVKFGQLAEEWRARLPNDPQRPRKAKTIVTYENDLRVHVLPVFGGKAVGSITYADVDDWIVAMGAKGSARGTIRNAYKVVKQVLDFARKRGHIRVNPCGDVTWPEPEHPEAEMLFLTPPQIATLADAVPAKYRTLIYFAAYTGLRAGEIAALRVRDLDWDANSVRVTKTLTDLGGHLIETEPKTKKARRTVWIPEFVMAMLRDQRGDRVDGYLFGTAEGKPFRHGNFYRRHFKPAVASGLPLRLEGLRFHDLRHTFASLMVAQGVHPKEMSEQMGHSSVEITLNRYAHLMPHRGAEIAQALDAAYATVTAEPVPDNVVALR